MVRDEPTTLWRIRYEGRWVECVVRLVPIGIDVEIVDDGTPIVGQTFTTEREALAFAKQERSRRQTQKQLRQLSNQQSS